MIDNRYELIQRRNYSKNQFEKDKIRGSKKSELSEYLRKQVSIWINESIYDSKDGGQNFKEILQVGELKAINYKLHHCRVSKGHRVQLLDRVSGESPYLEN